MIFTNSDTTLHFNPGVTNSLTGAYVNNAAVVATLKDLDGVAIGNPITMSYVAASNGDYSGTIPLSVGETLDCGQEYIIDVSIVAAGRTGGGRHYEKAGVRSI